ncbi:MMPL family transporter [Sanguibacter antarcticus]|uniref:MMPL family transporter n=1 Tax=Sanguibacter antarcticus TaxID=372484 RepID=UPI0031832156
MFESLGRRVSAHPRTVVAVWSVLTLLCVALAVFGVHGENLFSRLTSGEQGIAGSESYEGTQILDEISTGGENISLIVEGVAPAADGVAEVLDPVQKDLLTIDGVLSVLDPVIVPEGPDSDLGRLFTAADGNGFLIAVSLEPGLAPEDEDEAISRVVATLRAVPDALAVQHDGVTGLVGGTPLIIDAVTDQVERDLTTGEAIALPIALIVMVFVFGGFLAAAMPMAGALASIGVGLGFLLGLSSLVDVDASVVNVVTLLGLGLSIDYGLLIVSRFREELRTPDGTHQRAPGRSRRRGRSEAQIESALVRTMTTAGRTVAFSALTVAISLAGLMVFTPEILRSIGAAGLAVILIAAATALTLVPAILRLSGNRLERTGILSTIPVLRTIVRRTADVGQEEGVFSRLARRVQRRPGLVAAGCVVVLLVLAFPALGLQMRNSGIELLPPTSPQRVFVSQLAAQYPSTATPEVTVVTTGTVADTQAWITDILAIDGVESATTPTDLEGHLTFGVELISGDPGGSQAVEVVTEIRALDTNVEHWVTGQAASQVDFTDALLDRVLWAVAIVVVATLVLLFLMTGSLIIPVKALLTNALSIAASMGVLVWVFQDGHLSGILGFASTGGIETFVVALVVAFAFGLAMDYEVFLLSRIKELHDAGEDPDTAVSAGLQRSGRIITSAATVIIVVFAGFVFGDLLIIKQVGFALAVAIFIDATIVRMLLVPATMTLLGRWNWWAPGPLRALHDRIGIAH